MNSIRLNKINFLKNLEYVKNYIIYIDEQKKLFEKLVANDIVLVDASIREIQKRF